jgi:hypothetical protein
VALTESQHTVEATDTRAVVDGEIVLELELRANAERFGIQPQTRRKRCEGLQAGAKLEATIFEPLLLRLRGRCEQEAEDRNLG